jgi:hypothetical protein
MGTSIWIKIRGIRIMDNDMGIKTFDQWMDTLVLAVDKGKQAGLSDNKIKDYAKVLGNLLAANIVPDAPENAVLKSLWEHGNDEEKRALASMMVKMVESYQTRKRQSH